MQQGISIIIPVVNEAARIAKTVRQFKLHPMHPQLEVIVVDGGSKDKTRSAASDAGAIVIECEQRSRAVQMNEGAKHANYDILYFVHADVAVPESFYDDIMEALQAGFGCGYYRSDFDSYPGLMKINAFMTRFKILSFRGGDQTLFIAKHLFQQLNGFDAYYCIMEDYDFIRRIWKSKIAFKLIQKAVTISTRKYQRNSWLRVQIANGVAMFMFNQGIRPEEIKKAYRKLVNHQKENYKVFS